MLDGTEIYKAVHHSRGHKSGHHDHLQEEVEEPRLPPGVPPVAHIPTVAVTESEFLGSEDRGAMGESKSVQ